MNQEVKAAGVAFPKRPHIICISIIMILLSKTVRFVFFLLYPQLLISSMYWAVIVAQLLLWSGLLLLLERIYAGSRGWLIAMLVLTSSGVLGAMVSLITHPTILYFQVCLVMEVVTLIGLLLLFSPSTRAWVTKIKSLGLYKKRGGITALIIMLFVLASVVMLMIIVGGVIKGIPKKQFITRIDRPAVSDFCYKTLSSQNTRKAFKTYGITKNNCLVKIAPVVKQCDAKISVSMPCYIDFKSAFVWRIHLDSCLSKAILS